ncbi:MAG: hypothetical protein A3C06_01600 [Candidatus Taylorbacteria bacterium RIFCSPHIGHO2_02_FULL_46_13]|uniref:Uncharacterized protein n=1 Tax=Candidatus Taylorbacteria bacterium RIFCSPHIGHO2_02_FULL_46_13 TaxID=1802312 RepID=A0A1G2MR60_9BACT|nr:MAG: hypothetical protein A3C06_01600 [Candidatus Taylorbacteria bacterium RIFCSPHIGHO2_02_FULL_46_13]
MHNPLGSTTLVQFLALALKAFVDILLPVLVIFYIATGLLFISARGNPEKLKLARAALLYISIGAAIVLGAWAVTEMISATIGAISTP